MSISWLHSPIFASQNNRQSSAKRRWETRTPPRREEIPFNLFVTAAFRIKEDNPSAQNRKRYGNKGSPCLMPRVGVMKPIWKLNVPPKVRNFVWRACNDILPTRANLFRKKVCTDPLCAICGQTDETVGHVLWGCPMARNVWAMTHGRLQKSGAVVQNFYHLARQLEDRLTGKDMETWATVAWSIWNARNKFCFEEKQSQPIDILQAATTLMQDYQRWNGHLAEPS
ncbi:hypothetical protein SO802_031064 [Lithocarpus litseifolius]|uniref:Reverse transcriptase zinc-binding domain-containing protein n=1 Tax=Lithocarpus litseifolius TaxID=425828 RepID=A0AAW2BL11_9ROSI